MRKKCGKGDGIMLIKAGTMDKICCKKQLCVFFALFNMFLANADDVIYTVKTRTEPVYLNYYQDYMEVGERIKPAFMEQNISAGIMLGCYKIRSDGSSYIVHIDADALYITDSDSFDSGIRYNRVNPELPYDGWIPSYYLEAMEVNDPQIILQYEPYLGKINTVSWKAPYGFRLTTFIFHDLIIFIQVPLLGYDALHITHLDNLGNGLYRAHVIANITIHNGISATIFDAFENSREYVIYIHHNKNRMRIYMEDHEEPIWELIKVSELITRNLMQFPSRGRWTGDQDYRSYFAPDIFELWPVLSLSEIKEAIARREALGEPDHRTTSNLRLRSTPDTSGDIITTLAADSLVYVLGTGDSATIDNITAPWVRIETKDGAQGWCFAGYLEPVRETAPASTKPDASASGPDLSGGNGAVETTADREDPLFSYGPPLANRSLVSHPLFIPITGAVIILLFILVPGILLLLKKAKRT
jgi:hypothetical protein